MGTAVLFALIASIALPLGAAIGVVRPPPRKVTAGLLAFASGALLTAVAVELFADAEERGGLVRAGVAFALGATVFIVVDTALDRVTERQQGGGSAAAVGFALLAGVTLDGVPENVAMGVALVDSASPALLVAIFASNLPEAVVGAQRMCDAGMGRARVMGIWGVTAVVLGVSVLVGYAALQGVGETMLAWPLGFAAGAVLASLADTLMPEAYREGGPWVAWLTALGFLVAYALGA